jgi:hypothetical protein
MSAKMPPAKRQPSAIADGELPGQREASTLSPLTSEWGTIGSNFNIFDEVESPSDDDLDIIDLVRLRLDLGDEIPDVTIAASLATIGTKGETRARGLVAFSSPLGKCLAARGADLNAALDTLLALAPKPLS